MRWMLRAKQPDFFSLKFPILAALFIDFMIKASEETYKNLPAYFDWVADTFGYPRYQRKFEADTVKSDNVKLHLDILTADKEAPTVVVMPGTAIYALCHAELMYKIYEHGYNVIGFDPRGHGQSSGERGDYTAQELMTDAQNVISYAIKRFNKKVSLFGSSQGGIIALYLAAKDNRLNSVICHTFADLSDDSAIRLTRHPRLFKYLKGVLAPAGKLVPLAHIPVNSYIDIESIPVNHFGNLMNFIEQDPLALKSITLRALQSLSGVAPAKPFEEITTPVLMFQGDADSIFPVSYTESIFNRLTCKKKIKIFKGRAHSIVTENVDEYLPTIVEWLKEIYPKT